jgi:sarcosine oxidase subunit gamma
MVQPGRFGRRTPTPGGVVGEVCDVGLARVTARRDQESAFAEAVQAAFGLSLSDDSRRVEGRELTFIWSGPGQWLVYAQPSPTIGMEGLLIEPLGKMASIVDQSHALLLLQVAGPKARDTLAKGVAIDLHPRAFRPGDAAVSSISQIVVHLSQRDEAPTYELAIARSLALSFWDWLETSAAEYGLELAT